MRGKIYKTTKSVVIGTIKFSRDGYSVNDLFIPFDKVNDQINFSLQGYKKRSMDGCENFFSVKGQNYFSCFFQIRACLKANIRSENLKYCRSDTRLF